MKIDISLSSGYAGSESDLISLKNPVPNGDFHYFGLNPISHDPNARRLNDSLDAPSTIKRRKKKKKEAEATVDLTKPGDASAPALTDGLGEKANLDGKNVLPDGADMYYGLKPLEHNPISHLVLSAEFGSRFALHDPVWFQLREVKLPGEVLAVTFMAGKVLYTLAVYTGFEPTEAYTGQYGLINSIGWDDKGREYLRIDKLDSTFVEPREIDLDQLLNQIYGK